MFKQTTFLRVIFVLSLVFSDLHFIRDYVNAYQELPFQLNRQLIHEFIPRIPAPTSIPDPPYFNVQISEADWQGKTFIAKISNKNPFAVYNTEIRIGVSPTKEPWNEIKIHRFTVPVALEASDHVYFSKTLPLETNDYWWSVEVASTLPYNGETVSATPSGLVISPTKPKANVKSSKKSSPVDTEPWGVALKIDDVTWTIKVKEDDRMATLEETLLALNEYRKRHGAGQLSANDQLAAFAKERAVYLNSIKSTDKHAGFQQYIANEDNIKKLGFGSLGENSGYGHQLIGVHLIEWIYGGDPQHNANQLDRSWSHVGIGIEGLAVVFIFGGSKF